MARRQLNKKFLTILTVVVLGGGMAVIAAKKFVPGRLQDPAKLIAQGDKFLAEGQLEKAREQYQLAVQSDQSNTTAMLKLGDVLSKMTAEDPTNLQAAHAVWTKAVSVDPKFTPALDRLLDSYWDVLDYAPQVELFGRAQDLAEKLLAVDPGNTEAAVRKHIAVVRRWLVTQATSRQDLDASVKGMLDLMKTPAQAGNADLPTWVSQVKVRRAQEMLGSGQTPNAQAEFDEVAELFDQACKDQPKNGPMHFRAFQVYNLLTKSDPRTRDGRDDRYAKRAAAAIATAQAVSTDKDPQYNDIQLTAADWYRSKGDAERAKQIVKALYESHKDDQRARLAMAKLLASDKATRGQAVEILSREMAPAGPAETTGFKALIRRELEGQTLYELVLMRLADLQELTAQKDADPKATAALQAEAEAGLEKLRKVSSPRAARVLGLEGRLALMRGQTVEAVKALEEAVGQTGPADYEQMFLLARAYLTTRQTGPAKAVLEKIVAGADKWAPPRALLARLMLEERNYEGANQQIKAIQAFAPDYPELKSLDEMSRMLGKGEGSDQVYTGKPETTREERLEKARFAILRNMPDEAIRLIKLVLQQDPKDVGAWRTLVGIYESRQQKDRVRETLAEALRNNPDDLALTVMSLRAADAPADQVYKTTRPLIEKQADEFTREVQLYELEVGPGGDPAKAMPHLARAHELRPTDVRILDTLFGAAVRARDWATAEGYLRKLVAQNADQCGGLLYQQRFAMAKGDLAAAEKVGQQLVTQYKEFAQSYLSLAQVQQAMGKFEEAAHNYAEVRKKQTNHYDALRGLVECYYQVNQPEQALNHLRIGRQQFPNDVTIRELYLNHLVNYADPREAIKDREKLRDERPTEPGYHLALASTYFHAAQYVAERDANAVGPLLQQAFGALYTGAQRFPDDGRFYAQQAEMLQYAGQIEKAEGVLLAFAQRDAVKDRPLPWLMQSEFYVRAARPERAAVALQEALIRADKREAVDIRLRLAAVQVQLKQFDEAVVTLNGAGAEDDARVLRQRVEILIAQGDLKRAEAECLKAMAKQDSPDLRNLYASILIDTGRVAEAFVQIAHVQQKMDPRNEVARYLYALALVKQPRPDVDSSVKQLVEIRNRNPRNVQVRLLLAELFSNTGKRDTAVRELTEALAKVPTSKEVRMQLIRQHRSSRPPNYQAALELAQRARLDPVLRSDPEWPRQTAITYMAMKDVPKALMAMDVVIAAAPDNLEYHRERLDMILQFNDYAAVLRESDKLLAAGKDAWWLRHQRMLAQAKLSNGSDAEALAELDRGLELCKRANDINSAEFMLRGAAGVVTARDAANKPIPTGYDQAIRRVQERLSNDPDNRWHILLAALHRGKGDFAGATALVERMLADPANRDPARRAPVLRAAADVYTAGPQPNHRKAMDAYVELLKITPEDLASLNNAAYLRAESLGEPQQAKEFSRRAYETSRMSGSPNDLVYDTHGWVLTLAGGGDEVEGLKILQEVVNRRPELIESRYHLGESYMRQDPPQWQNAAAELQKALDLITEQEKGSQSVDKALKDKVTTALVKAKDKAAKPK